MFPVLFHFKKQERIIPCLPSAWHSGAGWVPSSLLPSWRKILFYPGSPTCAFPILTSTVLPRSATALVWCSAALWAFLSPGKASAGLESLDFNFLCFSWWSSLAKKWPGFCFCCFLLHWQGNSWAEILTCVRLHEQCQCQEEGSVLVSCVLANAHFAWVVFHAF